MLYFFVASVQCFFSPDMPITELNIFTSYLCFQFWGAKRKPEVKKKSPEREQKDVKQN